MPLSNIPFSVTYQFQTYYFHECSHADERRVNLKHRNEVPRGSLLLEQYHTHTRTHAYTHTRTPPHSHTHTHTRTHAHTHTRTHALTHSRTHALMHTRTHAHALHLRMALSQVFADRLRCLDERETSLLETIDELTVKVATTRQERDAIRLKMLALGDEQTTEKKRLDVIRETVAELTKEEEKASGVLVGASEQGIPLLIMVPLCGIPYPITSKRVEHCTLNTHSAGIDIYHLAD